MMKLFMLFSYFVDGFAYAGEALVGKKKGETVQVQAPRGTITYEILDVTYN